MSSRQVDLIKGCTEIVHDVINIYKNFLFTSCDAFKFKFEEEKYFFKNIFFQQQQQQQQNLSQKIEYDNNNKEILFQLKKKMLSLSFSTTHLQNINPTVKQIDNMYSMLFTEQQLLTVQINREWDFKKL